MDIFFGLAFVVSFTGLLLAFISANKVHARLLALHAENESLHGLIGQFDLHRRTLRDEIDRLTHELAEARALIDEWNQPVPQSEWQKKCAENERLRDALNTLVEYVEFRVQRSVAVVIAKAALATKNT